MTKSGSSDLRSLAQFSFGDSPKLADALVALVLAAKKNQPPVGRRARDQRPGSANNGWC